MSKFDDEEAIGQLLRESRPVPDAHWRGTLRRSLVAEPSRWHRLRRIRVATVAVAGAAAAFIVAGLLGGGPLSGLSDEPVTAKDNCRYVIRKVERRVPTVVDGKGGPRIEYQLRQVDQRVKRCD